MTTTSIFTPRGTLAQQPLVRTAPTAGDQIAALQKKVADLTTLVTALQHDMLDVRRALQQRLPTGYYSLPVPGHAKSYVYVAIRANPGGGR